MDFANKNSYEGDWKEGKMDGEGTFYWINGSKYIGIYVLTKVNTRMGRSRELENIFILRTAPILTRLNSILATGAKAYSMARE